MAKDTSVYEVSIKGGQEVLDGNPSYEEQSVGSDQIIKPANNKAFEDPMEAEGDEVLAENERWPTEEELETMTRVSDRLPVAAVFVVATEFCERFTYYGVSGIFQNYMQNPYKTGDTPGAIDGGQSLATGLSNFFQFWCYVTPILGAIVADQYWGKYKTILVFAFIYMLGDIILTCTSIPASIRSGGALPGLIVAMIVIGLGTGGIKSNVSPMVAEQYNRFRPFVRKQKNGKEVLVHRDITVQSIFNWFYWSINVGSLSSIATTELELNVDFWPAYLLPTLMFIFCIGIFAIGKKKYVVTPPTGSILILVSRAYKAAFTEFRKAKKEGSVITKNGQPIYWMDYAKPSYGRVQTNDWNDTLIDELRRTLKACKIFLFYPVFWLCYGQMQNNLISQAGTMKRGNFPNDMVMNINSIVLIIFIPIFDRLIYPGFRRCGLELGPVTRIFLGFCVSTVAMAYTTGIQQLIYTTGPNYDHPSTKVPNDVSMAYQIPSYFFMAIAEILSSITGLEYAYTKAPPSMKSVVMSLFLLTNAGGSILAFALNPVAHDPRLRDYYMICTIIMGVFAILFYLCFRKYDYYEREEKVEMAKNLNEESNQKFTIPSINEAYGYTQDIKGNDADQLSHHSIPNKQQY
ncbi:peptide transporter ptr2 [Mycoemilia scoparia]|uniref:Peptide transporter ptr2 n=1 Tax=Mycoemilia scoparia TaxID=417184 RepID=A0A9W8DNA1_9FUNG|nr:peptide transporter ptr2 [Mycoemilia scoparia]